MMSAVAISAPVRGLRGFHLLSAVRKQVVIQRVRLGLGLPERGET